MNLKSGYLCFKQLEEVVNHNLKLTPEYSSFLSKYQLGKKGLAEEYFEYEGDLLKLTCINYSNIINEKEYENTVLYFKTIQNLSSELINYKKQFSEYHTLGFIEIGKFDIRDSILLGIKNDIKDQIWKLDGETQRCEFMELNISAFIEKCSETIISLNLASRGIGLDKLIKRNTNWEVK